MDPLLAAAVGVALLHAALVVLAVSGALLALRRPRLVGVHAAVLSGVVGVHLLGAACPLTTWERSLRERAGAGYQGGFLEHYLFGPLGLAAGDPGVQAVQYAVVLLPNLVGYGLLVLRAFRRARGAAPARAEVVLPG